MVSGYGNIGHGNIRVSNIRYGKTPPAAPETRRDQ